MGARDGSEPLVATRPNALRAQPQRQDLAGLVALDQLQGSRDLLITTL